MIPKRLFRLLLATAMMIGLVSVSTIVTVAATPSWSWVSGTNPYAMPSTVKPGKDAGFVAEITNDGPSNISQLYGDATFSQGTTGSYVAAYIKASGSDTYTSVGPCTLGTEVDCSFGALRPGDVARLVVAFPTKSNSSGSATATITFETTGLGSSQCTSGGDNSHGDCLQRTATVAFSGDANYDGGFVTPTSQNFATGTQFGPGNWFATSFKSLNNGTVVILQDDTDVSDFPCPDGYICYGKDGQQAVLLNINGGQSFGPGNFQPVTVQIYKDAVPNGSNVRKVTVFHEGDDPITADCPKGDITSACRTVDWDGKNGVWTITVYVNHNGSMKFA